MPVSVPINVSFPTNSRIDIRFPMDGQLHVFSTGRKGHTGREYFDWNGKSWLLQFRAFITERSTETTEGMLAEESPDRPIRQKPPVTEGTARKPTNAFELAKLIAAQK